LSSLRQQREKLIICTKVRYPMNLTDVNSVGLSRNHILASVDQSLKRLKTDYVDILSVNGWDEATSMADVLRTMDTL
jgi:aryl-alcohol dehydrogenase-like predicted oxidoreductase